MLDILAWQCVISRSTVLGIGKGNPGVFHQYPCPYSQKPVPVVMGTGLRLVGLGVAKRIKRIG